MISTSNKWKEHYKNGGSFTARATLVLADQTEILLTDKDIMSGGVKIEDSIADTMSLRLGTLISSVLRLTLNNTDSRFDGIKFRGSRVTLDIGALYDDGTDEWIQRGVYYVEEPRTMGFTIELTCYDAMVKLDKFFSEVKRNLTFPCTAGTLLSAILWHCGVSAAGISISGTIYAEQINRFDENATCRDVVEQLFELTFQYGKILPNGRLNIFRYDTYIWDSETYNFVEFGGTFSPWTSTPATNGGSFDPWNTDAVLDGGLMVTHTNDLIDIEDAMQTSVETHELRYGGIVIFYGDSNNYYRIDADASQDKYVYPMTDNKYMYDYYTAESAVDYFTEYLMHVRFRPFETVLFADPALETGDWVIVRDYMGRKYISVITNLSYSLNGTTTISLGAESPEELEKYADLTPQNNTRSLMKSVKPLNTFSGSVRAGETEKIGEYKADGLIVANAEFQEVGFNRITLEDTKTSVADGMQNVNLSHIADGTVSIYAYSDTDNEVEVTIQERG